MHLSLIGFPEGGGGADVGDFMGTLQQISALVVREMWGLGFFECPTSRGECGDFASGQPRRVWKRSIVRSIDSKMAEEKKKVCFKIHCFWFIKQTIRQKFVRICRHKQL